MFNKYFIAGAVLMSGAISANASTLSLSPFSRAMAPGETAAISVVLNTDNSPISGVDMFLTYDPQLLRVEDDDSANSGVQIKPGTLMPVTVSNSVADGKIQMSQVTSGSDSYSGQGTLATFRVTALASGAANINFNFTPGSGADSNIASNGQDVLSQVTNGTYTISTSAFPGNTSVVKPFGVTFVRTLQKGSRGDDVKLLQEYLVRRGFLASGNNTGYFGSMTEAAVQALQRAENIVSSGTPQTTGYGVLGPRTRDVVSRGQGSSPAPGATPATPGDRAQQIKAIQDAIKALTEQLNSLKP